MIFGGYQDSDYFGSGIFANNYYDDMEYYVDGGAESTPVNTDTSIPILTIHYLDKQLHLLLANTNTIAVINDGSNNILLPNIEENDSLKIYDDRYHIMDGSGFAQLLFSIDNTDTISVKINNTNYSISRTDAGEYTIQRLDSDGHIVEENVAIDADDLYHAIKIIPDTTDSYEESSDSDSDSETVIGGKTVTYDISDILDSDYDSITSNENPYFYIRSNVEDGDDLSWKRPVSKISNVTGDDLSWKQSVSKISNVTGGAVSYLTSDVIDEDTIGEELATSILLNESPTSIVDEMNETLPKILTGGNSYSEVPTTELTNILTDTSDDVQDESDGLNLSNIEANESDSVSINDPDESDSVSINDPDESDSVSINDPDESSEIEFE